MVIHLEDTRYYKIEEVIEHRPFLIALSVILDFTDFVVFSTYGSTPEITGFFRANELPIDERVRSERARLALYRDEYPDASAYILSANQKTMESLAELCHEGSDPSELCDHLFAYGPTGPLLCFHDAFKSDPLYISQSVSEPRVAAFCSVLGKAYTVEESPS